MRRPPFSRSAGDDGRTWRLYDAGAKSLIDDHFELDLAWVLGLPGTQGTFGMTSPSAAGREHRALKTFMLVFGRESFVSSAALEGRTFHHHALSEGRLWEAKVRDIARSTDERTGISAIILSSAAGNKLPLLMDVDAFQAAMLTANFSAMIFDYVLRLKLHSTSMKWFIVEQPPVVPAETYDRAFGPKTARDIVRDSVLRLTYTASDMQPFARDMGHDGAPFRWDEAERRHLRARLDALYFLLYGVTDEADVAYVLSTFPIVARNDVAAHGMFLTRDLILWYMRALAAGDPDAVAPEADLIREARQLSLAKAVARRGRRG